MKFNPYAALLMTGALMITTVIFAQAGDSAALLKAGAVSVDRDVSIFAARTVTTLHERPTVTDADREMRIRMASIDKQSKENASPN